MAKTPVPGRALPFVTVKDAPVKASSSSPTARIFTGPGQFDKQTFKTPPPATINLGWGGKVRHRDHHLLTPSNNRCSVLKSLNKPANAFRPNQSKTSTMTKTLTPGGNAWVGPTSSSRSSDVDIPLPRRWCRGIAVTARFGGVERFVGNTRLRWEANWKQVATA